MTPEPPLGRPLGPRGRAWLTVNLIRLADFARRLGVAPQTVASWKDGRYDGFPEPVLQPDRRNSGAVYWLPDLLAFTKANALPDTRYMLTQKDRSQPHRWTGDRSSDRSEEPGDLP